METVLQRFENICRACMAKAAEMQCLFNPQMDSMPISKMFSLICTINISPDDGLPNTICSNCLSLLITAHDFQQMCLNSETEMRNILTSLPDYKQNEQEKFILTTKKCENIEEESNKSVDVQEQTSFLDDIKPSEIFNMESQQPIENITEFLKVEQFSDHDGDNDPPESDDISKNSEDNIQNSPKVKKEKKTPKSHECEICKKIFAKRSGLIRHMNVHNAEGRPFECDICKQRFTTESLYKRHSIIHSETLTKLTTIMKKPEIYKCSECPREFQKQESLSSHMRTHKDVMSNREFSCEICSKIFPKLNSLTRHLKTHDEMKRHKCNLCNRTFSLSSHLIDHMNRHNGVRPHVCHVCQKSFQQSSTLKDHLRTHSGEKPFLCAECGKAFNNSGNLRQHLLRHTGVKRFPCPECPSKFPLKGELKSHMITHTGIKRHTCDICGSSFTKGYSLGKHKRIHTGEKPYSCEVCGMRSNSSHHIKRHMRIHTGEKPYSCKFCDRAFSQSNDLVKHTRVHIGEKTYKCSKCPEAFRLRKELRMHNQDHYKEEQMANE